jgi:hypothetical protein
MLTKQRARQIASSHKQRAKTKYNLTEHFTGDEWYRLCAKHAFRCVICGVTPSHLSPDHMLPLIKGGSNTIDNIMPTCLPCNLRKHTKIYVWSQLPRPSDPYKAWHCWKERAPLVPPVTRRTYISLLCSIIWSLWPIVVFVLPLLIGHTPTLWIFVLWQIWGLLATITLE